MAKDKTEKRFSQDEVNTIVQDRLERDRRARVTSEPRTYALDSPHSFFNDAACVSMDREGLVYPQAHQRMLQWGAELAHEVEARSAEGRYVERVLRNHTRVPDEAEHRARHAAAMRELRALTTGGGSGAGWSDAVLHQQLSQKLEEQLDSYVITQALAAGNAPILNNVAWTANNLKDFYNDIAQGEETLTDTAGTRLRPTHFFSTYDFYMYVSHLVDGSGRPLLPPAQLPVPTAPRILGADDGQQGPGNKPWWARFTGQVLPGGVYWFTDDNIPASGADTQVIVSNPEQAVILLESPDPVFSVFPQTVANNLEIVFILRS